MRKQQKGRLKNTIKSIVKCSAHPDKVAWARGFCKNCYDKWLKATNPEYVAKQKKSCKKWCEKYAARLRETKKRWVAKQDKTYTWARSLKTAYGITPDDYLRMLAEQNGVCNICGQPPKPTKRLAVDHCHKTGKLRGLLCFRCNFGLSFFSEDADKLQRAANHLRGTLTP